MVHGWEIISDPSPEEICSLGCRLRPHDLLDIGDCDPVKALAAGFSEEAEYAKALRVDHELHAAWGCLNGTVWLLMSEEFPTRALGLAKRELQEIEASSSWGWLSNRYSARQGPEVESFLCSLGFKIVNVTRDWVYFGKTNPCVIP